MKQKVMIGMSGGVDSSAAAGLLLEQGYDVVGVTFRLWKPQDEWPDLYADKGKDDIADAKKVCDHLGIPHHVIDMREEFKRDVIENFVSEYQAGRTPSPCIVCNQKIKFGLFYEKAKELGADFISTGHYARISQDKTGIWQLKTSFYPEKDQSYFLYHIPYDRLPHILFPLGNYTKPQVREIAAKFGFEHVSRKKDSQEICFIDAQEGYGKFLERYVGTVPPKGNFVDSKGNPLGQHKGIWYYTVGQRKGLGMAFGKPMYVASIDPSSNTVCLKDDQEIYHDQLTISDICYLLPEPLTSPTKVMVKIRNRAPYAAATLIPLENGNANIQFDQPQRAITKGQSAVCYQGEAVIAGGVIIE